MSLSIQEARRIIRNRVKRVPEGEEITHLNIMPMMDMMTILLVAFIFQVSQTAEVLNPVALPKSMSVEPMSELASVLVITKKGITVQGKHIVSIKEGQIDEGNLDTNQATITPLVEFLSRWKQSVEAEAKRTNRKLPAVPELMVLADRMTHYRVLQQVMASAGHTTVGYGQFRLIVMRGEPQGISAKQKTK